MGFLIGSEWVHKALSGVGKLECKRTYQIASRPMLIQQATTRVNGESITMRFPKAKNTGEAINAMQQHVKVNHNVDILKINAPLEVKLVVGRGD